MTVGRGTGMTVVVVDVVLRLPIASVTVPDITNVPTRLNTCDTTALPVTAPRLCVVPSPQSTVRSRTALPFDVAAVTANVKEAGSPTLGGLAGGVITSVGAFETTTVTEPDAVPDELGALGGGVPLEELELPPPPVAGGACAPTLAVTVACWLVIRMIDALPLSSVGTIAAD